jgi:hypothetical protein
VMGPAGEGAASTPEATDARMAVKRPFILSTMGSE